VVLPARDYERRVVDDGNRELFRRLLASAEDVETMPYPTSSRAAYFAASEAMLNRCDLLLAVWDGKPSRRVGDTADVVRKAREMRIPVTVIWPPGHSRAARRKRGADHRIAAAGAPAVRPAAVPDRD